MPSEVGAHELPVQLTSFIGREREIAVVRDALRAARLLTLTGPGGSGKTRLALELAGRVAGDYGELAWVELAALSNEAQLPYHLAAMLGVRDDAARPPIDVLIQALRSRSMLLILDNCEHLADACAVVVESLLRGCAQLAILATSREALGVAGERAWLVPPLSLPAAETDAAPDRLLEFEAVQLFVTRARDVVPAFALHEQNAAAVVQICRRLDGLPLAIELAAARVRVLAPEQIAERLGNVFALLSTGNRTTLPRQRTLRATIDWSYQLLTEPEQLLLQRLSVFVGGFTLDAAEAVCTDEQLEDSEVLDLLTHLVDRSLVVMRESEGVARYHLLETVRQYAAEHLREAEGKDAVLARHAACYLALAEAAAPHLFAGAASPRWMTALDYEIDNLRSAGEWFLTQSDTGCVDGALRLFAALHWYWFARGRFNEARTRLEAAVLRAEAASPLERARARVALANVALWQGDHAAVDEVLDDAVDTLRALQEWRLLAYALVPLGWARLAVDAGEAYPILQEAVRLSKGDQPEVLTPVALYWLGFAAEAVGRHDVARTALDEAISIGRVLQHEPGIAHPLSMRGQLAILHGDLSMAAACLTEALLIHERTDDLWGVIVAIERLAEVATTLGDPEWAARLLGAAEGFREKVGLHSAAAARGQQRDVLAELRFELGEARLAECRAAGRTLLTPAMIAGYARTPSDAGPARTDSSSVGPSFAVAMPAQVPALRVRTLGPLSIERESEPLPAEAWPYAKPKELLLYLLSHPDGRTREQIGLAFWPESSPAQVKNSFHVTLHHLRKALGHADWIEFQNGRYRISPDLIVDFDAALFEQQVTAAMRDTRAGAGSIETLRTALALYRGDFLQDETTGDWHLEIRDHLCRLCIEGLFALGELLMQAESFAEAAEVYQQLVRKEDLHEEAHRRLMLCLARTGERLRALRHYERLVVLLREDLDAEPEEQTTGLYEHLKKAETV